MAHRARHVADDLPIRECVPGGRHRAADALHAALGIHEGAVLFKGRRCRQEHVAELPREFVEEQILHDDEIDGPPSAPCVRIVSGLVNETS